MRKMQEMTEALSSPDLEVYLKRTQAEDRKSWLHFMDGYERPSPAEIVETFLPFTTPCIAKILGLKDPDYVCEMQNGTAPINYQKWRLFLLLTGRVLPHSQGKPADISAAASRMLTLLHSANDDGVPKAFRPCYRAFHQGFVFPTASEIRDEFDGFPRKHFADLIGVSIRSLERYLAGEIPVHYAIWRLFLVESGSIKI